MRTGRPPRELGLDCLEQQGISHQDLLYVQEVLGYFIKWVKTSGTCIVPDFLSTILEVNPYWIPLTTSFAKPIRKPEAGPKNTYSTHTHTH